MFEDDGSLKSPVDQTYMSGGEIESLDTVLRDGHSAAAAVGDVGNVVAAVVDVGDEGDFESIEVHRMARSRDMVDWAHCGFVDTAQVLRSVAMAVSEGVNRSDAVAHGDMQRMTRSCLLAVDPDDQHGWNHQIRHRTEIADGGGDSMVTTTTVRMQLRTKWAPLFLDGVLKSCFLEKEGLPGPRCEDNWKTRRKMNEDVRRQRAVSSEMEELVSGRWTKSEQNCDRALLVGLDGGGERLHDLEEQEARLIESRAAAEGAAWKSLHTTACR
jgi:hypothetical protein